MRRSDLTALAGGISAQLLTIGIARFAFTPLMPLMQEQAGLSYKAGAWLGSTIHLRYLAGTMTLVVVRNSGTRYRLFQLCLILAVLSTFAMAATTDVWAWAWLRFFVGASGVGGMPLASEFILQRVMRLNHSTTHGYHSCGLGIVLTGVATMICGSTQWGRQYLAPGFLPRFRCSSSSLRAWLF